MLWLFIIHQIFSLARDRSKRVTWPNNWGISQKIPKFSKARVAKKIWRIIKTLAFIWGENMLGYLSLDIIVPRSSQFSSSYCSLLGTDNVREQIPLRIFAPNGGYCWYIDKGWLQGIPQSFTIIIRTTIYHGIQYTHIAGWLFITCFCLC